MDKPGFNIQTRQKVERILSTDVALGASAALTSGVLRSEGYDAVVGLAVSDQAGQLRVLQAGETTDQAGNLIPDTFVQTNLIPSIVDAFSGKNVVQLNTSVIGEYIKLVYENGGVAQLEFNFIAYLLPEAAIANVTATIIIPPIATVETIGKPGTTINAVADTAVGALATAPLPVPPVGTRRMTIQNTGPAGSRIRVRQVGGPAGSGILLTSLGSISFGGADGAIAAVEAEDVTAAPGLATTVGVTFEEN